jgi:hypothetical protein
MAFTAEEIANINNAVLENYIEKGTVFKQNVSNKPMLKAFDDARGSFAGGNEFVSVGVKSGQGGGSLGGYTHDDLVTYYNPATIKRAKYAWKEHHIGITVTHTELKTDGVDIDDNSSTSKMSGRDEQVLANLLDEKLDDLGEDYARSLDLLVHGDGTSDTKALAGIRALVLDNPAVGTTGGVNRAVNSWWRNRARTTAAGNIITSNVADGGALLQALQVEMRQLGRYAQGGLNQKMFAGSDFIDALEKELRANGNYTQDGFMRESAVDGGMAAVKFKGKQIIWDPTLDDIGRAKFMYVLDMRRIRLLYMNGQRMKKHNPSRPYDRYVMYNGITSTAVMAAQQLNTSGVYQIS